MKYVVLFLVVICAGLYLASVYFNFAGDADLQEKTSGFATIILFVGVMPFFLAWRYIQKQDQKKEEENEDNL